MTAVDSSPQASAPAPAPLLLPTEPKRFGPVTRRLLLRLVVVTLAFQGVAAWLIFGVGTDVARAAGTSIVFPGAGFLYTAHPLWFLATGAALVAALVAWWSLSTHFAIPLVWAASVAGAAWTADGPRLLIERGTTWGWAIPVAYALAVAIVARSVWRQEKKFREKRNKVADLNTHLATAVPPQRSTTDRRPDAMDVELFRWVYDFADQPDDGLKGLDWGEQFHSGTQLRYQLNTVSWATALYAANQLPNCTAQVEAKLAKVIEKHTDLRAWGYWRTLNLLGNFDPNPDPIRRDNIMFSAFLGDVLNLFEAATGSTRFDEPGSLTFVWKDGRSFPYDHHSIAEAVRRNFDKSKLGFFPCEPGWSFTVCNVMGAQALLGHDALHGTKDWDEVRPGWVRTLEEEYMTPDGAYLHIRSNHVGLSWDTGEVPRGEYLANGSNRLADILPQHAARARALELKGVPEAMAGLSMAINGEGQLPMDLPPQPERHRTRSSALPGWTGMAAGARTVGNDKVADAALASSVRQCGTGKRWPDRPLECGAPALFQHMLIRWSTRLDGATLNTRGYVPPTGPVVTDAPFDDVLVVRAYSPDGVTLDLVLEPMGEPVEARLGLSALTPGGAYVLGSERFTAAADGTATVTVPVPERVDLELAPA